MLRAVSLPLLAVLLATLTLTTEAVPPELKQMFARREAKSLLGALNDGWDPKSVRASKRKQLEFSTCGVLEVKLEGLSFNSREEHEATEHQKLAEGLHQSASNSRDHGIRQRARSSNRLDTVFAVRCQTARDATGVRSDGRSSVRKEEDRTRSCYNDFDQKWVLIGTYNLVTKELRPPRLTSGDALYGARGGVLIPVELGRTALQCGLFSLGIEQGVHMRREGKSEKASTDPLPWSIFRVSLRQATDHRHISKTVDSGHFEQNYGALTLNTFKGEIRSTAVSLSTWFTSPRTQMFNIRSAVKRGMSATVSGPSIIYAFGKQVGEASIYVGCSDMLSATRNAHAKLIAERPSLLARKQRGEGLEKEFFHRPSGHDVKSLVRKGANRCPIVMAHRGVMGPDSPENTVRSLRRLMNTALDGAEVDVFLVSRPGPTGKPQDEVVLAHDPDLRRTLGINEPLDKLLKTRTLTAVMKNLNCQGLQPLRTVLYHMSRNRPDFFLDIELKPGEPGWYSEPYPGYSKRLGHAVGKLLRQYRSLLVNDRIVVSSFDSTKTRWVNEGFRGQPVRTAGAEFTTFKSKVANFVNNMAFRDRRARARVYHYSLITPKLVQKMHAKGWSVGAYTLFDITEPADGPSSQHHTLKNLFDSGVDWIETDDPFRLLYALHKLAPKRCGRWGNKLPSWMETSIARARH